MSIANKLATIAENEQKVFDAGKKAEYDAFWDAYQDNGNPLDYTYAFAGGRWRENSFHPKYDLVAIKGNSANSMFYYSRISKIIVVLDLRLATSIAQTFYSCSLLKTISLLKVSETTMFGNNTFGNCPALENITIEGVIAQSTGFPHSSNLTHDSLMSIIGALKDFSGTGEKRTLTLHADAKARLTDAEKAIATQKGWTLA